MADPTIQQFFSIFINPTFLLIFFIVVFLAYSLYFFLLAIKITEKRRLPYTFDIYKDFVGDSIPRKSLTTRGRYVNFGITGDDFMFLPKLKRYWYKPKIIAGVFHYNLYERPDGELQDFNIESIDALNNRAKVRVTTDLQRSARLSLNQYFANRYSNKETFIQKNLPLILIVVGLFAIALAIAYMAYKNSQDKALDRNNAQQQKEFFEAQARVVQNQTSSWNEISENFLRAAREMRASSTTGRIVPAT